MKFSKKWRNEYDWEEDDIVDNNRVPKFEWEALIKNALVRYGLR